MGRGSSGAGGGGGGGAGLNPANIVSTAGMVSVIGDNEGGKRDIALEVMSVSESMLNEYGTDVQVADFQVATLKGSDALTTIAYYDGQNIAFNERFFDEAAIAKAYANCVKQGFHPSNGNKSPTQAVAAHEYGHHLTEVAAGKMGYGQNLGGLDAAANRIVSEARPQTSYRGTKQMARSISGYAGKNAAEAIAEAVSDVYCNGRNANKASQAIVNVLNGYLRR